ncbi:hypothetical protein Tco_0327499, partial [Tanacetum coccineum]
AGCNHHQREMLVSGNNYTRVNYNYSGKQAHPSTHRNIVPRVVLMKTGLRPLNTAKPVITAHPKTIVYNARPMSHFLNQHNQLPKAVNTARPNLTVVNVVRENQGHPQKEDQCYVDSGCSRHMTGDMSYLSDFKEFDGGYVTFGGGAKEGKITSKGTHKTSKLDFEDVYFVKELQFNLFSVSQMCDKKNSVLFTDTGCFVLSPNSKLTDESQATLDESMLWHRRLGHTRGMTKNRNEHGFISAVFEGKSHEDLHTCLFACFISQEEPKRIAKALSKRAIGTKWIFMNKKDERGIVTRKQSKASSPRDITQIESKEKMGYLSVMINIAELLRKFGFTNVRTANTPMNTEMPLLKDSDGDDVVVTGKGAITASSLEAELSTVGKNIGHNLWQHLMSQVLRELVQGQILQGEGSTIPVESYHTPTVAPSTSQLHHSLTLRVFIRQETKVPRLSSPTQTHVADEVASTGVYDRHGGAVTTVSGLEAGQGSGNIHKTPTMPYDSPLPRVHKLGSDEGRMQPNELMELVTKLSDRVAGRQEYDLEPNFEFTAPKEVYTVEPDISTAGADTKTKIQKEQERLGFEEAQRLQEQFDEEERQRIASVHEKASTFKLEEWDNIKAQIEADEELAHMLQAQEREGYFEADKAKLLRANTFTPMQSDDTVPKVVARSSKRSAEEELSEESSKRQKIGEGSETAKETKDKESDELS